MHGVTMKFTIIWCLFSEHDFDASESFVLNKSDQNFWTRQLQILNKKITYEVARTECADLQEELHKTWGVARDWTEIWLRVSAAAAHIYSTLFCLMNKTAQMNSEDKVLTFRPCKRELQELQEKRKKILRYKKETTAKEAASRKFRKPPGQSTNYKWTKGTSLFGKMRLQKFLSPIGRLYVACGQQSVAEDLILWTVESFTGSSTEHELLLRVLRCVIPVVLW